MNVKEAKKLGWYKDLWNFWVHKNDPSGDAYRNVKNIPNKIPPKYIYKS